MAQIKQVPLRKKVRDHIAEQLWSGAYSCGEDLNEARLAAELGVSRTPLREGLVMLASEGLIQAHTNRGFHVPAADSAAVAELYPVIGTLERLAVQTSSGDLQRLADDLDRINARLNKPPESRRSRNQADAQWHARLIANCPNATLKDEIELLRARSRCIDGALFRGLANAAGSFDEHAAIAATIRAGRLEQAADLVNEHWLTGIDVVTSWIEEARAMDSA